MKFELDTLNRNTSDKDLLDDLKRVAEVLDTDKVTIEKYNEFGKYHYTTLTRRFGNWFKSLEKAGLKKTRNLDISDKDLIKDLIRVANKLDKNKVTTDEYNERGKFHSSTLIRHFGNWFGSLEKAGLEKTRNYNISDEELFKNIEEVWSILRRQPHYQEMIKPLSKFSSGTYEFRFGTWRRALEKFVKYINSEKIEKNKILSKSEIVTKKNAKERKSYIASRHKTKRGINWRLRFLVMRRDKFKCVTCGRNPATNLGIILHVDHILAWDKGGETVIENLQTLCSVCNIGKSNLNYK